MKEKFAVLIVLLALFSGCGPKEIGQGTSSEPSFTSGNASAAEVMRYPFTGAAKTQRFLYYSNRPDVMEATQKWRLSQYQKMMGINPEQEAYREHPKMRSPFKQ